MVGAAHPMPSARARTEGNQQMIPIIDMLLR
jgi:hypothetical protein